MNLISIPALKDNYIWILYNKKKQCVIIDPGEATSVLQIISVHNLTPIAILLTHHHQDHVGGISEITRHFSVPVYGPRETYTRGATKIVNSNTTLVLLDRIFRIINLPGHTLGHIGFYSIPWLFSGDTIFSAGCGRIFEGTAKQMFYSFQEINKLPINTLICAAHEYTLSNLDFIITLLPHNSFIKSYQLKIKKLRLKNQASLPTTLYLERKINPFLGFHDADLRKRLNILSTPSKEWYIFSVLRSKKDHF